MNAHAPSKTKRLSPVRQGLILSCVYLIFFVAVGCKKAAPPAPLPPTVGVMEVTTTNVPLKTEIIGQLDSPQNVEVRARVESFVDKMLFTEGTEVHEGDQLFLLDKKPFLEKLAGAKGMLAQAKAALSKHETDVARLHLSPQNERFRNRILITLWLQSMSQTLKSIQHRLALRQRSWILAIVIFAHPSPV